MAKNRKFGKLYKSAKYRGLIINENNTTVMKIEKREAAKKTKNETEYRRKYRMRSKNLSKKGENEKVKI